MDMDLVLEFEDYMEELRSESSPQLLRLRDSTNPIELYTDTDFKNRFRFSKHTVLLINDRLKPHLHRQTNRHCALTTLQQLTTALFFYSSGSYQRVVGDSSGILMSRSCVSKTIKNVSNAIASWRPNVIKLPAREDRERSSAAFEDKCGFPGVVGAIDATHVAIQKPDGESGHFVNRKGFYSLNCQFVCDQDMKFLDIIVRWPGSTHDARIFDSSQLKGKMENRNNGILLGDPGYPCRPYLLTPIRSPRNRKEENYNMSLRKARLVIERAFGVLKRRFSVLGPDSRIRLKLDTTMAVIVACAVLHNIAINEGDLIEYPEIDTILPDDDEQPAHSTDRSGALFRQTIINRHFS